jgi:hypothetical protein
LFLQNSFVIAKVDLEVQVASKLGKYYWAEFLKSPTTRDRQRFSCLFEYNYIELGDQSEKREATLVVRIRDMLIQVIAL